MIGTACIGPFASAALSDNTASVELTTQTDHSFELTSGEYRVRYDPQKETDGWIVISRAGTDNAIGTKLAQGQGLDITAAGAGEGDIYQWKPGERKDSRIFRSLTYRQTSDGNRNHHPLATAMGGIRRPARRV